MPGDNAEVSVVYHVKLRDPGAHLYDVSCRIENPAPDGQLVSLPVWVPGSYLLREFARHVVRVGAESGGNEVAVRKLDKHTWHIAPVSGELLVHMSVYAADRSVRGAWLDRQHAFFNGSCLFLKVEGHDKAPSIVHVDPPDTLVDSADGSTAPGSWRLATGLERVTGGPGEFGAFRAGSYAELIDNPVLMGDLRTIGFQAAGVPHALVLCGMEDPDHERLQADLARLCTWHIDFFGRPAPFSRYAFLARMSTEGRGGLEHKASAVLGCGLEEVPGAGAPVDEAAYRRFLGLVSHEYFHAWNVKRIRPAEFVELDLSREAYTQQLWIFEGITSYYDDLALRRCGLMSVEQYLEILGQSLTRLYRTPGRRLQTLEEASFDAWIKFYRPDENTPNATISYYLKGSLVALALDLTLRSRTAGTCSLDAVMRTVWQEYGADDSPGLPRGQFEETAARLSGLDLGSFFDQALRSTVDPPLGILLAQFGVRLQLRSAEGDADQGGRPGRDEGRVRPWLGMKVQARDGRLHVSHVVADGPGQRCGVLVGDELVAIGGQRIVPDRWERLVGRLLVDKAVEIHVFRDQRLQVLPCHPVAAPRDTCYLALDGEASLESIARRNEWLGLA